MSPERKWVQLPEPRSKEEVSQGPSFRQESTGKAYRSLLRAVLAGSIFVCGLGGLAKFGPELYTVARTGMDEFVDAVDQLTETTLLPNGEAPETPEDLFPKLYPATWRPIDGGGFCPPDSTFETGCNTVIPERNSHHISLGNGEVIGNADYAYLQYAAQEAGVPLEFLLERYAQPLASPLIEEPLFVAAPGNVPAFIFYSFFFEYPETPYEAQTSKGPQLPQLQLPRISAPEIEIKGPRINRDAIYRSGACLGTAGLLFGIAWLASWISRKQGF